MAQTILGIDVGQSRLKLALMNGRHVKKHAVLEMPENLVSEGRIVSPETMGEFLRMSMKEKGIRAGKAAYVFAGERVYIRPVTMPLMNEEQLLYNLPYEFRDYITEELKDFVFDYAMISANEEERTMEVMAAAIPRQLLEDTRSILKKAGLKLVKAAPVLSVYQTVLKNQPVTPDGPKDYCILDIGYSGIRMYAFKGDKHLATNELETGLHTLGDAIAEAYNVDPHIAHTYLVNNYDDCQNKEVCANAFNNIGVELMRTMNFLRYSMQDSSLNDVWVCGGGADIPALLKALEENLDMKIHSAGELLDGYGFSDVATGSELFLAAGITQ
ncbi:MAG: pilus assembly protein PilM [Lachnospiraceae bacterium]|nr:pilus assembly protein PilM [Lachnospiraceae bacterium]